MWVIPLGLGAGALTTIAGLGGGMMMVLILSLAWDPQSALAVTAPALLLGNAHRVWLFRKDVDRPIGLSLIAGAVPAAFLGGLVTVALPTWALHWLILGATSLALLKKLGGLSFTPGPKAMLPVGAVGGLLTATTGGGGLVMAPMLLAAGLGSEAYVATGAAVSVAVHVARIGGYGAGGLIDAQSLSISAVLAIAIVVGNALGAKSRRFMKEKTKLNVAWAAMGTAIALAVVGVT